MLGQLADTVVIRIRCSEGKRREMQSEEYMNRKSRKQRQRLVYSTTATATATTASGGYYDE